MNVHKNFKKQHEMIKGTQFTILCVDIFKNFYLRVIILFWEKICLTF